LKIWNLPLSVTKTKATRTAQGNSPAAVFTISGQLPELPFFFVDAALSSRGGHAMDVVMDQVLKGS
jgi:hypothetical protein